MSFQSSDRTEYIDETMTRDKERDYSDRAKDSREDTYLLFPQVVRGAGPRYRYRYREEQIVIFCHAAWRYVSVAILRSEFPLIDVDASDSGRTAELGGWVHKITCGLSLPMHIYVRSPYNYIPEAGFDSRESRS